VGWRRFVDRLDWIAPDVWQHEHNILHHGRTGERVAAPDLVEATNLPDVRAQSVPRQGSISTGAPVETAPPNVPEFKPAFLGQPRPQLSSRARPST
jgi:hypothetical protein